MSVKCIYLQTLYKRQSTHTFWGCMLAVYTRREYIGIADAFLSPIPREARNETIDRQTIPVYDNQ